MTILRIYAGGSSGPTLYALAACWQDRGLGKESSARMNVYHLNGGLLHAPPGPQAACHCLLLEQNGRLALIDTGIGLQDIAHPIERIGQPAIDAAGFQFHERLTALRHI